MAVYLIDPPPGAATWLATQGIKVTRTVERLDVIVPGPGDQVIGQLPPPAAAAVCARGACYLHLMTLPVRRADGTASTLWYAGLQPYHVQWLGPVHNTSRLGCG